MKAFTWFLLFIIAVIAATGYYFYRYVYIPRSVLISKLNNENLKLKYEITDKLDNLYRKCSKKEEKTAEQASSDKGMSADTSSLVQNDASLYFAFGIRDLFKGRRLSDKGKAIVREFYSQVANKRFDSVRIVVNRRIRYSAKRALTVKKFLISLGLSKDKVWARLSKDVPKDSIRFRLLW